MAQQTQGERITALESAVNSEAEKHRDFRQEVRDEISDKMSRREFEIWQAAQKEARDRENEAIWKAINAKAAIKDLAPVKLVTFGAVGTLLLAVLKQIIDNIFKTRS